MNILEKIRTWYERRQYRKYLIDSANRSTDPDQIRRLHDRVRDLDGGGDGKFKR